MKRIYRYIALSLALSPLMASAGLDLPVKTINGRQFYYYVVKKGDTLYSLATRFNITRDDIVGSNPGAADMVRSGQTLYFPVDRFGDGVPVKDTESSRPADNAPDVIIHHVTKGETLYGISRKYDVDVESIIALNPSARMGVKAGSTLRIPVHVTEDNAGSHAETENTDGEQLGAPMVGAMPYVAKAVESVGGGVTPVDESGEGSEIDNDGMDDVTDSVADENADGEEAVAVVSEGPSSIAVLLPFMLDSEAPGRQAMLYTDFYKGLLVAADSLSGRGDSIRIYAYDTMDDAARVRSLLQDTLVSGASVIIAPSEEKQMAEILKAVDPQKTRVLNVFNVRDSSYVSNPAMIQANIPHRRMYEHARQAIDRYYPAYIPVILRNESGRSDKAEFISYITEAYRSKGVEPIEIVYDGALLTSQLEVLPDDGNRYLLIPSSGSLAEFNKFSHAVSSLRNGASDSSVYALFGYPDWTAFRNDAEQMLHNLGATVYSRFYYDEDGFDATCLNEAFGRWFGNRAIEVVPHHGMLGFDVGNLLIRNIRMNDGYFNPAEVDYKGAQSSFRFIPADGDEGGCFNDDIYVMRFNPDGRVERLSL